MAVEHGVVVAKRRGAARPRPYQHYAEVHRALRGAMQAGELARAAGYAPSVVTDIEQGRQRPSRDYLERIAPVVHVDVFTLMEMFGYVVPAGHAKVPGVDTLTAVRTALLADPRMAPRSVPVVESLVRLLLGEEDEAPAEE